MIRTRIAPSPTGEDIHIGNLYTALVNWVVAKKNKGKFVVRIEDTDRLRYVPGAEEKILATLKAYKLIYDEGPDVEGPYKPYRQSQRLPLYLKYARELVAKGKAYYCFCTPERLKELREKQLREKKLPRYDRFCLTHVKDAEDRIAKGEKYVIRLKVPENREIIFHDLIRGEIKFHSRDIDDQVLIKSDGYPTYHLAVVVDDHLMEITHVIRAEEWISSVPKHILIYEGLGWSLPLFAHLPILRNPDRSKLSKRKNPVWASWYLAQGYLPEAVLNYLALMGWSHPKGEEIFDLDEYVRVFDLKDIAPVGPIFDIRKLEWLNGEYIRKIQNAKLKDEIYKYYNRTLPQETIEATIPLIKERIKKLSDYLPLCEFFYKIPEKYDIDFSSYKEMLEQIYKTLRNIDNWKANTIGETMQELAKQLGVRNSEFFMVLRVAVTGKKISPPLNESMEILGKEESLRRIEKLT